MHNAVTQFNPTALFSASKSGDYPRVPSSCFPVVAPHSCVVSYAVVGCLARFPTRTSFPQCRNCTLRHPSSGSCQLAPSILPSLQFQFRSFSCPLCLMATRRSPVLYCSLFLWGSMILRYTLVLFRTALQIRGLNFYEVM